MGPDLVDPAQAVEDVVAGRTTLRRAAAAVALRRAGKGAVALAVVLAFLAGCVDAIGFIRLGGIFVSFMSGNSTRLAIALAEGDRSHAAEILGVILAFVTGAGSGAMIGRTTVRWRQTAVLGLEATLLAAAASTGGLEMVSAMLMAAGMGLENAVFASPHGETTINLTFMTGALVKVGEGLAAAASGGPRWSWLPFLVLWVALVLGAATGALCYARFGVAALIGVSGAVAVVALASIVWRPSPARATDAPGEPFG